jgi:hypothetical protein
VNRVLTPLLVATLLAAGVVAAPAADARRERYPKHTGVIATTFWVGEIFDPDADDGSQMYSTYDDHWYRSYGGCDGVIRADVCHTERRASSNGWFPRHMTPRQNPFYLDLPYDDLNDRVGYRDRGDVIPWAHRKRYADDIDNPDVSLMKDRWVKISSRGHTCYGQIEDAGPGKYHDATYVFGRTDARPTSKRYNNAGMDVSPALNGCLGFRELDGDHDRISWRFVDDADVPPGPWTRVVTNSQVR